MANPSLDAVHEARRDNLRTVAANLGGQHRLAQRLGYNRSYISQMIRRNSTYKISEKAARKIESALTLPPGFLDVARVAE